MVRLVALTTDSLWCQIADAGLDCFGKGKAVRLGQRGACERCFLVFACCCRSIFRPNRPQASLASVLSRITAAFFFPYMQGAGVFFALLFVGHVVAGECDGASIFFAYRAACFFTGIGLSNQLFLSQQKRPEDDILVDGNFFLFLLCRQMIGVSSGAEPVDRSIMAARAIDSVQSQRYDLLLHSEAQTHEFLIRKLGGA